MSSMEITTEQLDEYRTWLRKYGRSQDTAAQYANNVRRAYDQGGPFERLTDPGLSPKYLHLNKAALKAWALFLNDMELLADLNKIRLPPALRREEGVPLTDREWRKLRKEIDRADYLKEPMRAELGMLVCRGFRCGDVLRIKRKEVTTGLRKGVLDFMGKGRKRLAWTVGASWKGYLEILADHTGWDRVEDLICPNSKPGARSRSASKAVARALERCGTQIGLDPEDLHPHLLRHTYASFFYAHEDCRDPKKLSDHMGWNNIETAMGYVGAASKDELDDIADSMFD